MGAVPHRPPQVCAVLDGAVPPPQVQAVPDGAVGQDRPREEDPGNNRVVVARVSASASLGDLHTPPQLNFSAYWRSVDSTSFRSLPQVRSHDVTPSAPPRSATSTSASVAATRGSMASPSSLASPSTVLMSPSSSGSCPQLPQVEAFEEVSDFDAVKAAGNGNGDLRLNLAILNPILPLDQLHAPLPTAHQLQAPAGDQQPVDDAPLHAPDQLQPTVVPLPSLPVQSAGLGASRTSIRTTYGGCCTLASKCQPSAGVSTRNLDSNEPSCRRLCSVTNKEKWEGKIEEIPETEVALRRV